MYIYIYIYIYIYYILYIQGIIQKKSTSGSRMLPLVIFVKKVPFFPKIVFVGKTMPEVPFFKDSGRCPKILDYTLIYIYI